MEMCAKSLRQEPGAEVSGTGGFPATTGDALILQALKKMSGRTVTVVSSGDEIALLSDRQDSNGIARSSVIGAGTWRVLEARGFVVAEENGRWRLSNAGRIHLKRLMSRDVGRDAARAQETGSTPASAAVRREYSRLQPSEDRANWAESPLAWLRQRTDKNGQPLISQAQFEAGERLRSDFERGSMMARVTVNWSGTGGTSPGNAPDRELELRSDALAARERVRAALAIVGPELSGILIDVCCHLKGLSDVERLAGWPQRTAKVVLLMALTTLARHYRLMGGADTETAGGRVQHWGAEDYRPRA